MNKTKNENRFEFEKKRGPKRNAFFTNESCLSEDSKKVLRVNGSQLLGLTRPFTEDAWRLIRD
jgi:hypothetical protein